MLGPTPKRNRTTQAPLPTVMRRLMTGHAVNFNNRHKRSGHLFQNRYKSIVCEEDNYLLELTRYIHLNPLRAGLVKNLKELDKYPWAGHSAIIGRCDNPLVPKRTEETVSTGELNPESSVKDPACLSTQLRSRVNPVDPVKKNAPLAEKTIEDVLLHFGEKTEDARKKYRQFVKDGIERGSRPEFQGGGLIRSQGGDKSMLLGLGPEDREDSDQRILGSGDFVANALRAAHDSFESRSGPRRTSLPELSRQISSYFEIKEEDLRSPIKKRSVTQAKSVFGYLSIKRMGYSGREVGKFLNIRSYSAIRRAEVGQIMVDKDPQLWDFAQE